MQTSLTINSKLNDKKVSDKILHVNPNISDEQALQLAHAINNLTTGTYDSTTKTTTTEIDSESKPTRAITVNYVNNSGGITPIPQDNNVNFSQLNFTNNQLLIRFDYSYDGTIPIITNLNFTGTADVELGNLSYGFISYLTNRVQFPISFTAKSEGTLSFNMAFIESEQFSASSKNVTINLIDNEEG